MEPPIESVAIGCFQAGKQAGIREAVEFVTEHIFPLLNMSSVPVNFKDRWNSKLKEWGIDGN